MITKRARRLRTPSMPLLVKAFKADFDGYWDERLPEMLSCMYIDALADRYQIKSTAQLPLAPALADLCDHGNIEEFEGNWLDSILQKIIE